MFISHKIKQMNNKLFKSLCMIGRESPILLYQNAFTLKTGDAYQSTNACWIP